MITGHLVRSCGIYAPLVCGHEAVRLRLFGDEATALATPSHAIGHVPSSDVARGALAAHRRVDVHGTPTAAQPYLEDCYNEKGYTVYSPFKAALDSLVLLYYPLAV